MKAVIQCWVFCRGQFNVISFVKKGRTLVNQFEFPHFWLILENIIQRLILTLYHVDAEKDGGKWKLKRKSMIMNL